MKLLVTGGAGYIGSVVVQMLLDEGHHVEVLDDLSTGHADVIPRGVTFHQRDIHEVGDILTPSAHFDGVLHFAGKIAVGESVERPDLYWDVNVAGSLTLLRAIVAAKVPRLIFSSTGSVYAQEEGADKLSEDAPTAPKNPYATSKHVVERAIAEHVNAYGFGAATLRYFNAAGAWGRYGERHDPETHVIPIALQTAAGQRSTFQLFGDDYDTPDGTCVRDYIHVTDLATAHLRSLDVIAPGRHEIYNLGNGNGYSNREVVASVERVTGVRLPVEIAPRRPGDAATLVASSDKARRELGWSPDRPKLDDIVRDAWVFMQS